MRNLLMIVLAAAYSLGAAEKVADLDRYLAKIGVSAQANPADKSPGSLYSNGARLGLLGLDFRASQVNDILTIIVQERASAVSKGTVKTTRSSSVKSSVGDLGGPTSAVLSRLAGLSTNTGLNGEGETTRETTLNTSVAGRVVLVMPNGNLVVEANKEVSVNAETHTVVLRGIVRPVDLDTGNVVFSDRIAEMEVRVNGKGVVGSAIRRPFFLYRLLLGILPF
jgi:flagellar L-ring protein precursor FlgH